MEKVLPRSTRATRSEAIVSNPIEDVSDTSATTAISLAKEVAVDIIKKGMRIIRECDAPEIQELPATGASPDELLRERFSKALMNGKGSGSKKA